MLSRQLTGLKKLEGIYKYLKVKTGGGPRLINLEVTKLCNAACDFCPCWEIKDYPQLADYGPVMEKFKPIVLSLNGGEPFLRKDLIRIIDQVRPHCTYLTLITHGGLLTEERFRALWDHGVDQVSISRNYVDERHDEERKLPGLTAHFSKLLPALTRRGYDNIAFNTVIMDRNLDHVLPLAKQAHEWGVKISFSSYTSLKNDNLEYPVRPSRLARLEEVIRGILEVKRSCGHVLTSDYYLKKIPYFFRNGYVEDCRAGLNFIQMTPDGYVKRCSEMPVMMHWTEYDPAKVEKPNPCNVCWLSCRGETETPITPARLWEFLKHQKGLKHPLDYMALMPYNFL